MDKKLITLTLIIVLVIISLFTACDTTSSSSTASSTQSTTKSITSTTSSTQSSTTSVTTTQDATTTSVSSTATKWWEVKWGTPQYGGTVTTGSSSIATNFDPYNWQSGGAEIYEPMWILDPTLDRDEYDFSGDWTIYTNKIGNTVETWEWENPQTLIVHFRQDIYWQDKSPVNGRQFTAEDVVWHFDRMLGTGSGFTTPNPFMIARVGSLKQVTYRDKFTAAFEFGTSSVFVNSEAINETQLHSFEASDVYAMGQPLSEGSGLNTALNDWMNAVGTGPYMITDVVAGSSITYSKNPNYWAYDERYPDNRLPYIDTVKNIYISDTSTSLAALRTGKIDIMMNITWQNAESLQKTNSELVSKAIMQPGQGLILRVDREPFSDINVRKALQLAMDLEAISTGYYNGTSGPNPVGLINPSMCQGMAVPYEQWSQELKDEYSYNVSQAKQLLTDAGYPNGLKVTCDVFSNGDVQFAQLMKSYLAEVSIDMTLQTYDNATLMNMIGAKKHDDMVHWTTPQTMPPLMGIQMYNPTEPSNPICMDDPVYEEMLAACNTALTLEEASQALSDLDQYFLKQHWIVFTFIQNQYNFWQPYLKGYGSEKGNLTKGYTARWWIDQESKASLSR